MTDARYEIKRVEDTTAEPSVRRDRAWFVLGGLVAIGVAMIVFNDHPRPVAPPLVKEAHASVAAASASIAPASTPSPPEEIAEPAVGPPAPVPTPARAQPAAAPAVAKAASTYEAPSGSFVIDEPLRYVSAGEGESWRVATSKKVTRCVEMWGMGECSSLDAMELRCTFDKHGVLHCAQSGGFEKGGKRCSTPVPLEECISRASSGLSSKPRFDRGDVQLAEMRFRLRRAH